MSGLNSVEHYVVEHLKSGPDGFFSVVRASRRFPKSTLEASAVVATPRLHYRHLITATAAAGEICPVLAAGIFPTE